MRFMGSGYSYHPYDQDNQDLTTIELKSPASKSKEAYWISRGNQDSSIKRCTEEHIKSKSNYRQL